MKKSYAIAVSICLIGYAILQVYCLNQLSPNYDEPLFAEYGARILKRQPDKDILKFDSKLPVTAINLIPRAVEQVLHPGLSRDNNIIDIIRGRYISLIVSMLLALLVSHWSRLLYGDFAGFCSLILFLLCPNFLAHGIFLSSDIYACLFTTATMFWLWKFSRSGYTVDFLISSAMLGFAQVSKFSMIHLYLVTVILTILIFVLLPGRLQYLKLLGFLLLMAIFSWITICSAHLFYQINIPLSAYQFQSGVCQKMQGLFNGLPGFVIPLPSTYVKSLDFVIYLDHLGGGQAGSTTSPMYCLGSSSNNGFWYYYIIVFLFKLPISTMVVGIAAFALYFTRFSLKDFISNEIFFLFPAAYFFIYMSLFYSTQIGIRHILIILPLLYIFAGHYFKRVQQARQRFMIYALLLYQVISVGLYFPHFLPFTNELITDKKLAYRKIADTNLCYGEGRKFLDRYLNKNPMTKYLPDKPEKGKVVMEVNEMLNLDLATMGKFNWIRSYVPIDHIHSQYLVFDVRAQNVGETNSLSK